MQLFFAAAGEPARARPIFEELVAHSTRSNPASELSLVEGPGVLVGYESRAFDARSDGDRWACYLDGIIRSIDGEDVQAGQDRQVTLERVAQAYRRFGPDIWARLDGSFRLIFRDEDVLRVGTDIAGSRGVYWWEANGVWACHSHLMDLAPTYPSELKVDLGAVGNFCETGRYPPGRTAFDGVNHLGAGQDITLRGREVVSRDSYSRAPLHAQEPRSAEVLVDEMLDHATDAIHRSMIGAERPVFPLSGGMDSRLIVRLAMGELGPDAVSTITWGEAPSRAGSDAVIAAEIARRLDLENTWFPKSQEYSHEVFARAIYLSSGETDHAIHYPEDHVLHSRLAEGRGFGSIVRGDEVLGGGEHTHRLMTLRGAIGFADLHRIRLDAEYPRLLGHDVVMPMAQAQEQMIAALVSGLQAKTAYGKWLELYYLLWVRRMLAPYNAVKNGDLEVLTPLLDRRLNEWARTVPDEYIVHKRLLRAALSRLDPELASVPFASSTNLPAWQDRWATDPALADFFLEWFGQPGWVHDIGATARVKAELEGVAASARQAGRNLSHETGRAAPARAEPRLGQRVRRTVLRSRAGRLVAEHTLERRVTRSYLPTRLRLSRLAVLHGTLGEVASRRARSAP